MAVPVPTQIVGAVLMDGVTGAPSSAAGGYTPRVTATMTKPADATAYAIGDLIGNSLTAGLVVPIAFPVARVAGGSGRLVGARCVITAASGTIVLPAFDLLLFRPEANIPFAAAGYPADNGALNVSAAAMREMVSAFVFSATAWRNQAGGTTAAGLNVWQAVAPASGRPYAAFNLASMSGTTLLGLMQVQNTWTPTAIVNQFDFSLDVDQD